jgi:hypothetical protein
MFLKKIKAGFQNLIKDAVDIDTYISNYDNEDYDVDVETARHNYEAYQNNLNERCRDLIKKWCKEIKEASSKGEKFIFTNRFITDDDKNKILHLLNDACCVCDFPPDATLQNFQQYFEDRGFKVVRIEYPNNNICCLKIIWISSDNE